MADPKLPGNAGTPESDEPQEQAQPALNFDDQSNEDYEAGLPAAPEGDAGQGEPQEVSSPPATSTPESPAQAPLPAQPESEVPVEPPDELQHLRERTAQLEQGLRSSQQQTQQGQITQTFDRAETQTRQQLESQGYTPEQAQGEARRQRGAAEQQVGQQYQSQQHLAGYNAYVQHALFYAKRDGSDAQELINGGYESPQAMENASLRGKQLKDLQGENARLKQGTVPAAGVTDASSDSRAAPSFQRIQNKAIDNGLDSLTPAELETFNARYA